MSWDLKPVYLTKRTFLIFNQAYESFYARLARPRGLAGGMHGAQ